MNKLVLVISGLLFVCGSFAQIYKWTDSQGVVHFSDHPHEGAEKLKMPEIQTYSAPVSNKTNTPSDQEAAPQTIEHEYTKLDIIQPINEATIRNNQGYVVVSALLEPKLFDGDTLQMIFDGAPLGDPQPNLIFTLNGIYRGTHTLAVQVLNNKGEVLKVSDKITIFMQRPRVGMGNSGGP